MDFPIKDAAHMVGLTPRTLCYCESIGLLPEAERTSRNCRLFSVMGIINLIRIKRLTGLEFDLQHVRQVTDNPTSPEATATLDARWQVLTQQIDELQEKWVKTEETQNAQTLLDITVEFIDLEHTWIDVQSGFDVEGQLKLEIELLVTFADDLDRFKHEKLTRAFTEKHDDPEFRELRELDTRPEIPKPDASPEEIIVLVDDYIKVLGLIRTRFASISGKALALASAMEEFTYNEAQLTVITSARKRLRSSDGESPDPSQALK